MACRRKEGAYLADAVVVTELAVSLAQLLAVRRYRFFLWRLFCCPRLWCLLRRSTS